MVKYRYQILKVLVIILVVSSLYRYSITELNIIISEA